MCSQQRRNKAATAKATAPYCQLCDGKSAENKIQTKAVEGLGRMCSQQRRNKAATAKATAAYCQLYDGKSAGNKIQTKAVEGLGFLL